MLLHPLFFAALCGDYTLYLMYKLQEIDVYSFFLGGAPLNHMETLIQLLAASTKVVIIS